MPNKEKAKKGTDNYLDSIALTDEPTASMAAAIPNVRQHFNPTGIMLCSIGIRYAKFAADRARGEFFDLAMTGHSLNLARNRILPNRMAPPSLARTHPCAFRWARRASRFMPAAIRVGRLR